MAPQKANKAAKRATKWGTEHKARFAELVRQKRINPSNDDPTYIEKIRKEFWSDRKSDTFKTNWKSTVGEFRVGNAINEHNKRSELLC